MSRRQAAMLLRSMATLTMRQAHAPTATAAASLDPWRATHGDLQSLLLGGTQRHLHHPPPSLPGSQPSKSLDPESPWNAPNALSLARGASGPFIAYLIINEQWAPACAAVIASGATDWLDGYLARRMGLNSVLGSYLDPLGDKMLICSVALALAYKGLIPTWVVVVVVGRDVALVAGTVLHRWHSLGWRAMPLRDFLQTRAHAPGGGTATQEGAAAAENAVDGGQPDCASGAPGQSPAPGPATSQVDAGMPVMRPLMISKLNTVLQLSLIAGYLSKAWLVWPDPDSLHVLELATAGTTGASSVAYAYKYWSGSGLVHAHNRQA